MSRFVTTFGSLARYEKGSIEVINDRVENYAFSNIFDVAARSKPYEKVAVGKNLEYVIEAIRAEGTSGWMAASHDEFCVVMDGEVEVQFVKLDRPQLVAPEGRDGTVRIEGEPQGKRIGLVRLKRGHQVLLPKGVAYRYAARVPSVLIQQTIKGDLTVEKWREICHH